MNEHEFDAIAYTLLADLHPELILALKAALDSGATAERIAAHVRKMYPPGVTTELAIAAAYYLENRVSNAKPE